MRARVQWGRDPLVGWLKMVIRFHFKNKVRGDWDNVGGAVSDALQEIVYENDSQVLDGRAVIVLDSVPERIEVTISELPKGR